jgi:hypothetical protein
MLSLYMGSWNSLPRVSSSHCRTGRMRVSLTVLGVGGLRRIGGLVMRAVVVGLCVIIATEPANAQGVAAQVFKWGVRSLSTAPGKEVAKGAIKVTPKAAEAVNDYRRDQNAKAAEQKRADDARIAQQRRAQEANSRASNQKLNPTITPVGTVPRYEQVRRQAQSRNNGDCWRTMKDGRKVNFCR